MKLHLGCFHEVYEGWVNTDITPNIWIARLPFAASLMFRFGLMNKEHYEMHRQGLFKRVKYLNVLRRFPYRDDSAEAVFCSHMLEHLYVKQAERMFAEILRILKPGGVFRVAVPDLEWVVGFYDRENPTPFLDLMYEHVGGAKNSHKWMYTDISLKKFFEDQGFTEVRVCDYQKGRLPDVGMVDGRPETSIYVEGICPHGD
jgi:SAM-dependent methyltransferase